MEPIVVPAPSKSAFNKNRRVSDLLMGQLKHFQHVEHKSGIQIESALARDLHTEGGAARYIAEITRAIRRKGRAAEVAVMPRGELTERSGLSLAASADAAATGAEGGKP